jgi:tetratricopeptide (TPR) repeat protein
MTTPISNYFEDGIAYYEQGDYVHAVEALTKAIRLSLGDLAEAYFYRGLCYAYLEAYDKAMIDFNEALQHNAYFADVYNERGNLLRLQEDYQLAIQDYNGAITIDPEHYAAYYNRALAYEKLSLFTEAETDLSAAIEIDASVTQCYEVRGRIRALLKNYDAAIADLQDYLQMGGGHEFDNQSEVQSFIINLRINRFLSRFIPARFLPSLRI